METKLCLLKVNLDVNAGYGNETLPMTRKDQEPRGPALMRHGTGTAPHSNYKEHWPALKCYKKKQQKKHIYICS